MKNNHTPEIRFLGFTGDWELRKLGEGTSKIGDGLHGTPQYSTNGNIAFINGNNLINGKIVINSQTKYVTSDQQSQDDKELNQNTILMSINGTIGNLAWYNGEKVMLGKSAAYIEVSSFDKHFMYQLLQTSKIKSYFRNNLTGTTIKNLGLKTIRETPALVTGLKEQKKIGVFFKHLDETISLYQQELDILKKTKRGFLQKMFPKEGEFVPEVRFPGFSEDWQQLKFEDVLIKQDGIRRGPFGSALKKEFFVKDSDYAVYEQQNAIYDNYKTRYNISKEKFDELKNFQLSEGDFILSGAGTIGRISRVPKGIKQGVFNQALIRFKIDEDITDSEYFVQWIRSESMQRKLTGGNPGSAITNLVPMSEVKKWNVMVPVKNEQRKIGELLKKLDDTIVLHQRKLDALKETKKAFLQKMFV